MIVAGIDEVGYGPIVGPMVVSATALDVASGQVPDVWKSLAGAVSLHPRDWRRCAVVCDSKRLYTRKRGMAVLENTVFPILAAGGNLLSFSFRELLNTLTLEGAGEAEKYPWFKRDKRRFPCRMEMKEVCRKAALFKKACSTAGIKFVAMKSRVTFEREFNEGVKRHGNKARLLFDSTGRLLRYLMDNFGTKGLEVACGKHGGRSSYLSLLAGCFPDAAVGKVRESRAESVYVLKERRRTMKVSFIKDGEDRSFPLALASIVGKYLREVCMLLVNDFWEGHVRSLRKTTGYYCDAKLFLADIRPAAAKLGIDETMFVRCR